MLDQHPSSASLNGKAPKPLQKEASTFLDAEAATQPATKSKPKFNLSPTSAWKQLNRSWENLNIRLKLTLLLVAAAAVPAVIVTEGIIRVTQVDLTANLQANLERGMDTLDEGVQRAKGGSKVDANTIGHLIETAEIDLSNPRQVAVNQSRLKYFISDTNILETAAEQSFIVLTDAQGRVVAQNNRILADNSSTYPLLPKEGNKSEPTFNPVSVPLGASLGDITIFKDAMEGKRLLGGVELLKPDQLQRLGLAEQANIGIRSQQIQGLPEAKQPAPEGTYDTNQGKIGLVAMAVHPLEVKGQIVGSVITGRLLNRDYEIVDQVEQGSGVATATLFAQDWRISTNVPYSDKLTRAIGTRASREVSQAVLSNGETFAGRANIVGDTYLTIYKPLYDHRQEMNPGSAKPIGMLYVGDPESKVQAALNKQQLIGYAIGAGSLLLAGSFALAVAGTFSRPLRRIAGFAQEVGEGKQGLRLEATERQDEIGVLSRELNHMTDGLEKNLEAVRQQEELRAQEAGQQRREKEALQKRALDLLMEVDPISQGDLTIRARVTEDEIGTIADSYNATINSLRKIVIQVKTVAQQVSTTASNSEHSVQTLSTEALQQSEEISAALNQIQEMSDSIRAVAANAEQAEIKVQQAAKTVEEGDAAMNRTVDGIMAIRETVAETSKKVKRLGESSQKISKVVNLIGTFAAQTNLLALNASIEAARAGEEGRGFAVVADEVRSLARQSAAATAEIEKLVADIQTETNEVVAAMEAGTEQVVAGTKLVDETRQNLNKITVASAQISTLVESIAQAAVTQSQTSEAVSKTMSDVAAISNKTSAGAAEVSISFKELLTVAQELQANVGQFKVS
jgi:methyl-accepting chemotaxis protein